MAELGRGAKRTQVQSEGHDNDDDDSEVDLEEALEAGERLEQVHLKTGSKHFHSSYATSRHS